MISVTVAIHVPFHDMDILTVAWHGHYVKYCEIARTQLTKKLGIDWPILQKRGIVMPIVHFSCDYRMPLVYGIHYEVEASVVDPLLPKFSVIYKFREFNKNKVLATAKTDQVYIDGANGEVLFCIPSDLKQTIQHHIEHGPSQDTCDISVFWRK